MKHSILVLITLTLLLGLLKAERIQSPVRVEIFDERETAGQRFPGYQAGLMFSINKRRDGVWVDSVADGTMFDKDVKLPEGRDEYVGDVAISFDGRVAVSVVGVDHLGRVRSCIAWYEMDGTLEKVTVTNPFSANQLGFTADGSLWAFGREREDERREKPVHDVLWQYNAEGKMVSFPNPAVEPFIRQTASCSRRFHVHVAQLRCPCVQYLADMDYHVKRRTHRGERFSGYAGELCFPEWVRSPTQADCSSRGTGAAAVSMIQLFRTGMCSKLTAKPAPSGRWTPKCSQNRLPRERFWSAPKARIWYSECEPRRQMFTLLGLRSSNSHMLAAAAREP